MENLELLKLLGLSTYEARAYLSLLLLGTADASSVSSRAGIPTGRIYDVLDSLAEMSLTEVQASRPKGFKAIEPEIALKRLLARKKKELDGRFEQLSRAALNFETSTPRKRHAYPPAPFWNIALGDKEIHRAFEKRMAEAKREILMYLELEKYDPYDEPMFGEMLRALERGVAIKVLLGSQDVASLKAPGFSRIIARLMPFLGDNLEARVVEKVHAPYYVIDGEIATLNIKNPVAPVEYFAVISVWDKKLAAGLKEKFKALWKRAKELDARKLK